MLVFKSERRLRSVNTNSIALVSASDLRPIQGRKNSLCRTRGRRSDHRATFFDPSGVDA